MAFVKLNAVAGNSISGTQTPFGGGGPVTGGPLYDEITLIERLTGNVVLQEIGTCNLFVNERLSSVRHLNPSLAGLAEVAQAEASCGERLSAIASLFKH